MTLVPHLVYPVILGQILLLFNAEQVQNHGDREEDSSKEEQDLLLRLERCSEKGVCPVQTSESITDGTSKTCVYEKEKHRRFLPRVKSRGI